jgi:hypothetical protein
MRHGCFIHQIASEKVGRGEEGFKTGYSYITLLQLQLLLDGANGQMNLAFIFQ